MIPEAYVNTGSETDQHLMYLKSSYISKKFITLFLTGLHSGVKVKVTY